MRSCLLGSSTFPPCDGFKASEPSSTAGLGWDRQSQAGAQVIVPVGQRGSEMTSWIVTQALPSLIDA